MADVGASVLARLKNKASESGRSYQLCMQLFCQEEFKKKNASSPSLPCTVLSSRDSLDIISCTADNVNTFSSSLPVIFISPKSWTQ